MKNIILKSLLVLILGGMQACADNDKPDITPAEEKTFTLEVFYKKQGDNKAYPDADARVFIYYDIPSIDWIKYKYLSDGKFTYNDSIITPTQRDSVNYEGAAQLKPVYSDRALSVVVESHYYRGRLTLLTYENYEQSVRAEVMFNP